MMEQHYTLDNLIFFTLYGGAVMLSLVASLYLLLRPVSVFNTNITSPLRLRRWMAATFFTLAMSHVWWLLLYYGHLGGDPSFVILLCTGLDILFSWVTTFYSLLVMLQDRRRPLWTALVFGILAMTQLLVSYFFGSRVPLLPISLSVITLLYVVILAVLSVRQYGRWLRDNYSDLEHKEVWQNYLVVAAFLPVSFFYSSREGNIAYNILLEAVDILVVIVLLWRVDTLPTLEEPAVSDMNVPSDHKDEPSVKKSNDLSYIGELLEKHCVETQYYLNHDVSVSQLAAHIGSNRRYLGQYFAQQGISYNSYVNGLRIQHFVRLYRQALADKRDFTVRQLAFDSGFSSYSTFSAAFKQFEGCSVTKWTLNPLP